VRPHDVVVRFGGDEFLVFAADCSDEAGLQLAQRILTHVADEPVVEGELQFPINLTIGISSGSPGAPRFDLSGLLEAADAALYEAKAAGRCCVIHRPHA
jgi:diguanylate cyclase (GGDEF)-like protein